MAGACPLTMPLHVVSTYRTYLGPHPKGRYINDDHPHFKPHNSQKQMTFLMLLFYLASTRFGTHADKVAFPHTTWAWRVYEISGEVHSHRRLSANAVVEIDRSYF